MLRAVKRRRAGAPRAGPCGPPGANFHMFTSTTLVNMCTSSLELVQPRPEAEHEGLQEAAGGRLLGGGEISREGLLGGAELLVARIGFLRARKVGGDRVRGIHRTPRRTVVLAVEQQGIVLPAQGPGPWAHIRARASQRGRRRDSGGPRFPRPPRPHMLAVGARVTDRGGLGAQPSSVRPGDPSPAASPPIASPSDGWFPGPARSPGSSSAQRKDGSGSAKASASAAASARWAASSA